MTDRILLKTLHNVKKATVMPKNKKVININV